jgi:phage terminase large subunit-like protein|tara:strand:- start:34220 stop:36028 length:1809 start_codon:yes stop_codon:yes gene_type:complete
MSKNPKTTKAYKYANQVLSGKVLAGKHIISQAERFMNDLERGDLIFDMKEAEMVDEFFSTILYVPEFRRAVDLPSPHAFWLQQLYAFKYKDGGLRKYRSMYNQVARKNFKTFMCAGLCNIEMVLGHDPNGMIMQGANSRDQALICTDMTGKLIKSSPVLRGLLDQEKIKLFTYKKKVIEIVYEEGDRTCRVEAIPKDLGDGGNPAVGIIDEYHEAKGSELLETLESGQGQRLEPMILVITSPGHNKLGPCYSTLRKKSVDILNGTIDDDSHLPIVFELDNEEEWDNIDMLEKSNPMMPYSRTLRPFLESRIKKAKHEGGTTAANIKIKNSGIWIDAASVWIPSEIIKENNHGTNWSDIVGLKSYCGLDLAATTDLNAFVQFIPNMYERERIVTVINADGTIEEIKKMLPIHGVRPMFWIPEQKVKDQRNDSVDYLKWVEDGYVKMFGGDAVENDMMALDIKEELEPMIPVVFGADPKYSTGGPIQYLRYDGYLEPSGEYQGYQHVNQGFNLTGAVSEIETWINNRQLEFFNNPVMAMCFGNTTLHLKDMVAAEGGLSGHRYPSKGRSNGRIDGVSALCTAVHEYLRLNAEPEGTETKIEMWN